MTLICLLRRANGSEGRYFYSGGSKPYNLMRSITALRHEAKCCDKLEADWFISTFTKSNNYWHVVVEQLEE